MWSRSGRPDAWPMRARRAPDADPRHDGRPHVSVAVSGAAGVLAVALSLVAPVQAQSSGVTPAEPAGAHTATGAAETCEPTKVPFDAAMSI